MFLLDYEQLTKFYHPNMIMLLKWMDEEFRLSFWTTSMVRPDEDGIHGILPSRAKDLSCPDQIIGERICQRINQEFEYDNKRPHLRCAIYHKVEGGAWHIHLQVHENTARRY